MKLASCPVLIGADLAETVDSVHLAGVRQLAGPTGGRSVAKTVLSLG
jgi:hypothetical protein